MCSERAPDIFGKHTVTVTKQTSKNIAVYQLYKHILQRRHSENFFLSIRTRKISVPQVFFKLSTKILVLQFRDIRYDQLSLKGRRAPDWQRLDCLIQDKADFFCDSEFHQVCEKFWPNPKTSWPAIHIRHNPHSIAYQPSSYSSRLLSTYSTTFRAKDTSWSASTT